ncbi:hypothetical protein SEPCBS57363_005718 [Sporothrix epigloea]|uniref:Formin GTPase-binding domain-containing protein n=1 Tax=Sporothrix epigloea TaxID=1892477 RepID=A0ABP0E2N0_9PEZI
MSTTNEHDALPPNNGHHQRTKSSVLRSFMMHRRDNSQGDNLAISSMISSNGGGGPLEETSHNCQKPLMVQAVKDRLSRGAQASDLTTAAFTSTAKKTKTITDPTTCIPDATKENRHSASSPPPHTPMKKHGNRPTTNLSGLLSRPKSIKNLNKMFKDAVGAEGEERVGRGRERDRGEDKKRSKSRLGFNGDRSTTSQISPAAEPKRSTAAPSTSSQQTPIYAQFCTKNEADGVCEPVKKPLPSLDDTALDRTTKRKLPPMKPRPKSFHPVAVGVGNDSPPKERSGHTTAYSGTRQTPHDGTSALSVNPPGSRHSPFELAINPNDIDTHLEALLDRRNIPEHQRYKMRDLSTSIKMELIRQDWAEEQSKRQQHSSNESHSQSSARSMSGGSDSSTTRCIPGPDQADSGSSEVSNKAKHSRARSLTLSKVTRGRSRNRGDSDSSKRPKSPWSIQKKKTDGTLGRHLWTKSTESLTNSGGLAVNPSAVSSSSFEKASNPITEFFAKGKSPQQNSPAGFVTHLRTIRDPKGLEVGKLHKLRLLLRNETVTWIEDFIGQGGMEEVVGLLHRILAIEWREEHEDALLHENLLCLKALCTTALALQYLHSIHASLLPSLIHMVFDPEKKGPSEFTTRNIVTWVLFTYIQNAPIGERPVRAHTVLSYLRDPERNDNEKPVGFVLDMRKDRPYRAWCKEVVSVTKEVCETSTQPPDAVNTSTPQLLKHTEPAFPFMLRHFPKERPPVPAAPYVGGVEWEATNYLASHLDLVNAILACTPTTAERNEVRSLMKMSGWERCMGSSLRLCKEKFYGAVHDGLRVWVAAAYEDGWDVRDVRYGPPPPPTTPISKRRSDLPSKGALIVGGSKLDEPAPKLEIPKMDFILDDKDLQIGT